MSDDLRNRVARAIYDHSWMYDRTKPWTIAPENEKRLCYAMADAALAEIGGVRVVPLEWEDHPADDGPVMSKAEALHGTYFIVDDTDDFSGLYVQLISHDKAQWWQHVRSTCETLVENVHSDDLGPLKAAAQADYEARVLAALEPVTDGPNWEGFGRDLLESWPVRDVDGSELFDAALRNGLIQEIPGGYDPEQHIDAEGICPEKGDPWYEYAFRAQEDT